MTKANRGKLPSQVMPDFPNQFQAQPLDNLELGVENSENYKHFINLIGSPVTASPFDTQIKMILEWAISYESKVVCVANVHMLMEAYWYPEFSSVLKNADIVTPDGMPLVWMMRILGARKQNRVAGMDILLALCQLASQQNM